jgi:hypothetical protein
MPQSVVRFNAPVASVSAHDLPNAPQSAPKRHFSVFNALISSDRPSPDDRLDRLLVAMDALVLELALQHGEVRP